MRFIARIWARIVYRWEQETDASRNEINAGIARNNAATARKNAEQLTKDADALDAQATAIDESIKKIDDEEAERMKTDEYQKLTPKEKYEDERASKKERDEAVDLARSNRAAAGEKRELATKMEEQAKGVDEAVRVLGERASNTRAFADKIRNI